MHGATRRTLAIITLTALCAVSFAIQRAHAAQAGITITPATVTLSLAPRSTEQVADFTVTNHYAMPITLSFAFERRTDEATDIQPAQHLRVSQTSATLAAGSTFTQKIVLTDNQKIRPGSQLADLVVTQTANGGTGVGVLPSIRLPLTIIKEDGAVSSVALASFSTPKFGLSIPKTLGATIHNNGNMVTIPHGFVSITAPDGTVVGKGTMNVSSLAIVPGANLALATPLTGLANALWPGIYRADIQYGLGGGRNATTTSVRFVYVAWWHVVLLASLVATIYFGIRHMPRLWRGKPAVPIPVARKKVLLIGRDIS